MRALLSGRSGVAYESMSLTTAEIESVVRDLAPRLEGGKIVRIDQPDRWRVILEVRNAGNRYWLQLVAHPRFSRLHLLTHRPKQNDPAGGFCNVVRQHLTGAPVVRLRQVEGDRVVVTESEERDALQRPSPVSLVAELIGAGSNLILLDAQDQILGAMFTEQSERRRVVPGEPYRPLPPPPKGSSGRANENRFVDVDASSDGLALSRAVQDVYCEMEACAALEERRQALLARVRARLGRLESRRQNLQRDLERAENAEELRRTGELLKIALPDIQKGQERVVVKDLFEPNAPERTIELDPTLSPERNIEEYFQRYKKRKASREHVAERLSETAEDTQRLRALAAKAEAAEGAEALEALERNALSEGLLPPEGRPAGREEEPGGPRRFFSRGGLEILVARNAEQNHELTFHVARGNDCWMHLLGWEGPHVIIRKPRDEDVPLDALLDAAHLTIYYSRARGADRAEVVYTQRKHVQPIKGAGPGRVRYAGESTLDVRYDEDRLKEILDRREPVRT